MSLLPHIPLRMMLRLRPVLRWLTALRSSPRAIAGGFALGMFIAFTPTLGVQMILAVFFASIFRCNRAAAIVPVWITNPVTVAPIFACNYYVGQKVIGGPPVGEVYHIFLNLAKEMTQVDFWHSTEIIHQIASLGSDLILPLLLGSFIVGLVLAVATYIPIMRMLRFLAKRRQQRRILS